MAKKRKASSRNVPATEPQDYEPADARLGPITTYEDVADSEDEYFLNRDKIMLNDEPRSKRRRQEEDDMELSDEEVLGYDEDDTDDESKDASKDGEVEDEEGHDAEEGDDNGWWGSSKKEYYNADNIETEADAAEEEAEAKRIQQKKLSKMTEEDFIFDGDEWLGGQEDAEEDDEPVIEVLQNIEITDDMGPLARQNLLATRYPEFEYLVNEFQQLQPELAGLKKEAQGSSKTSVETVKYWVLGCYVASLASYFALLTSPARDHAKEEKTLDPAELRDHEVMEMLVNCRTAWNKVKGLKSLNAAKDVPTTVLDLGAITQDAILEDGKRVVKHKSSKKEKSIKADSAKKRAKAKEIENSLADLYNLPLGTGKSRKQHKVASAPEEDDNSDFGEEDTLDARAAADKAARKKSLKFYTSQIAQKANRRAGAGRDAGGDMDIPYRERLRDRQARLLAAAEKRGKKGSKHGADLGDDSDEGDATTASALRNDEDEYYDMVANSSKNKKEDKAARYAAYAAASKADRVIENEEIGEDGKRKITYAIEKNKGLTPKRGKDVRNPRVKKRKQYEAKKKKLSSMKPIWKGGEPKGGYQGERSGINIGVVKSVKL